MPTIADLKLDKRNARKRGPRAEGMLVASLQEVGAARSIVIDEANRVLAGNGTVAAAAEAGIERVKVVDADGETIVAVRRSGLSEKQKARLALLDNRTAELAEWDAEMLASLAEDGVELDDLWSADELGAMLAQFDPDSLVDRFEAKSDVEGVTVTFTFTGEDVDIVKEALERRPRPEWQAELLRLFQDA
jgi:hypothetical protein